MKDLYFVLSVSAKKNARTSIMEAQLSKKTRLKLPYKNLTNLFYWR